MKIVSGLMVIALASMFFAGCVTAPPNPRGKSDTLVVGRLEFHLTGFGSYGSATVNGKQTNDVQITLKNVRTSATVQTSTHGPDGFFFISGLKSDVYEIVRLDYTNVSGNWSAKVTLIPGTKLAFRPASTGVSNLGLIVADYNADGDNSVSSRRDFEALRTGFQKSFSNSKWNSVQWHDVLPHPGGA